MVKVLLLQSSNLVQVIGIRRMRHGPLGLIRIKTPLEILTFYFSWPEGNLHLKIINTDWENGGVTIVTLKVFCFFSGSLAPLIQQVFVGICDTGRSQGHS